MTVLFLDSIDFICLCPLPSALCDTEPYTTGIMRSTILAALAPHRLALAPASGSPLSFTLGLSPTQQSIAAAAAAAAGYDDDVVAAAAAAGYDEESLGMMRKTASLQVRYICHIWTFGTCYVCDTAAAQYDCIML
jgi:hypothetical protein